MTVIYPLVASSGNQRVLEDWITDHDSYALPDQNEPLLECSFDLCIVDFQSLQEHREELKQIKSERKPTLLPVLLLLPERRREIIESDRGRIADNVFATTIDEIVSLPIRQAELEWRIKALLRLRDHSISLQRKTEKLRRFQEAVEASGTGIFITDVEGTIEYANAAFEEITGYNQDAVIGRTPAILNSGEMSEGFFEDLWDTILSGETWKSEIVNQKKNGELYTAYQTIDPLTDNDGTIIAFVAVQTDITERKQLQNRLKRHRDIVQRLEDPIMLQGTDGTFRLVNEAMSEFAGLPENELLGNDESEIIDAATAARIKKQKRDVIETEEPATSTINPTFSKTGRQATFSTRRYPHYDDDDDLTGTIAIFRDISDLETRTRQLRVIDNVLRHNLRNSLTVIRNEAEHLHRNLSGPAKEELQMILSEVEKLETTGEKSRAITKVLSDEPTIKSIGLATSIRSIADTLRREHPRAQLEVDAPETLVVEATYNLDEAIEELVQNGIVHNDSDRPRVQLQLTESGGTVRLRIVDNGPGLPDMDREVLETGQAVEDLYHGSGLGLWLVYWVINRSNGSVSVSDTRQDGTAINIRLETPNTG